MLGYVDLHCHPVPGVDDGAPDEETALALLRGLHDLGFSVVVATPHMRSALFDNTREDILAAFGRLSPALAGAPSLPEVLLSSEHYLDDVVFRRLMLGQALPYPGERAVLIELNNGSFPQHLEHRLLDLRRHGLLPVIAHPERCRPIWRSPSALEQLLDTGAAALLDVATVAGAYGESAGRCAEELLDRGLYHAACSDAHRPADLDAVAAGIERLRAAYGEASVEALLSKGPRKLLQGKLP